jgi:uncharacterized membrane protein HdeD (DUF308 family)
MMIESLVRNWWLVALRGLVALILGIIMLVMPQAAALFLVYFIGAYALVDGVFALIVAVVNRPGHRDRWWLLLEGIVGVVAGAAIFASPILAAVVLLYIIGLWAVLTGVFEAIFAIAQWKALPDKWLLLLGGLFSALLGILILSNAAFGAVLIAIMIAVYLVLFGVLLIALGFSLKNSGRASSGEAE